MDGVSTIPSIKSKAHGSKDFVVILIFPSIGSIFAGKDDISVTLARFTFVSTDVWFFLEGLDLTPALLFNFGKRLLREAKTSVRAFCPLVLNLIEILPLGQIIKLINDFSCDWVVFGTIVKCTWAVTLIGRSATCGIDTILIIWVVRIFSPITSKGEVLVASIDEPVLGKSLYLIVQEGVDTSSFLKMGQFVLSEGSCDIWIKLKVLRNL